MRIAYLINQYPAASHSFIRREIEAVEAEGLQVSRFSVRPVQIDTLPDMRDRAELAKTVALLNTGLFALLLNFLRFAIFYPIKSALAFRVAFASSDFKFSMLVRRIAYIIEAATLAQYMRKLQVDHVHAHFGTNPTMVARLASIFSAIPYSFTVHGPDEFDMPGPLDLRGKVADSAFCVAISNYGRSQLMRWSDFSHWPKIQVVRCGVDASFLERQSLLPPPSDRRLCAIARLSGQKGIPLLVEAAGRLKDAGQDFRLTIVGDGEMRSEIEAMIERLGLSDVIGLPGVASSAEVIDHLLASRAMVLPSFAEGLPVVIMEALALERPVIVSGVAGTPELVDENCGWIIPAGSLEQLCQAMRAALEAPTDQLTRMGKIGRNRVLEMHDARKNGQKLSALFRQSIEGKC